jgi:hypothetical protein
LHQPFGGGVVVHLAAAAAAVAVVVVVDVVTGILDCTVSLYVV